MGRQFGQQASGTSAPPDSPKVPKNRFGSDRVKKIHNVNVDKDLLRNVTTGVVDEGNTPLKARRRGMAPESSKQAAENAALNGLQLPVRRGDGPLPTGSLLDGITVVLARHPLQRLKGHIETAGKLRITMARWPEQLE